MYELELSDVINAASGKVVHIHVHIKLWIILLSLKNEYACAVQACDNIDYTLW